MDPIFGNRSGFRKAISTYSSDYFGISEKIRYRGRTSVRSTSFGDTVPARGFMSLLTTDMAFHDFIFP